MPPLLRGAVRPLRHVIAALVVIAALGLHAVPARAADATVVVYPMTVTGSLGDADAGGRFSTVIAQRMAAAGGVAVLPYTPGTERAQYLSAAKSQGADYYVTGFLTPLGDEVSVVAQLVSTATGTIAWSQSSFVKTYADADAEADGIRRAILEREGRYIAQLDTPTSAQSEAPRTAPANQASIALTGGSRRRGRHRAASPTPAPAAVVGAAPTADPLATASPVPPAGGTASPGVAPTASATPAPRGNVSPFGPGSAFGRLYGGGRPSATLVGISSVATAAERHLLATTLEAHLPRERWSATEPSVTTAAAFRRSLARTCVSTRAQRLYFLNVTTSPSATAATITRATCPTLRLVTVTRHATAGTTPEAMRRATAAAAATLPAF